MKRQDYSAVFTQKSTLVIGLGVLAAWAILVLWSRSPYANLLDHTTIGEGDLSPVVRLPIFLAGWTLMVLAMMLPIELPRIRRIERVSSRLPAESGFLFRYLLGTLAVWLVFGGLLYAGDSALHEIVERSPLLDSLSWGFAGAILLSAGIYQFTPWKQNCLRAGIGEGHPHINLAGGGRLGWSHGIACLGSCWGLMLVMFAVGRMNLAAMLVVFVLMAAERFERIGRYATPLIGLTFVALGVAGLLGLYSGG